MWTLSLEGGEVRDSRGRGEEEKGCGGEEGQFLYRRVTSAACFLASKVPSDTRRAPQVLAFSLARSFHLARAMDLRTMDRDLGRAQEDNTSVPRRTYESICRHMHATS